MQRTKI